MNLLYFEEKRAVIKPNLEAIRKACAASHLCNRGPWMTDSKPVDPKKGVRLNPLRIPYPYPYGLNPLLKEVSTVENFQKLFFEAIFFNDLFSWISKCIVWYTSIEFCSQHSKFNFRFHKETKTTGMLFLLSITVHVVFFISFYCICWAVISIKIIKKIQHTDSAKI